MYKRYIKKRGKLTGPYYYTSVRLKTGKIKTVYIGKNPNSLEFKNKIALLRAQEVVSKGNIIVIPIEPGLKRPKREFDITNKFLALKEYFGDKINKIKTNIPEIKLPKIALPKINFDKLKLPKFKLPELKTAKEFYQQKLEEYLPKPGLKDFDFHASLIVLLSIIFIFGFFFLQGSYIGFTPLETIANLSEADVGQQAIAGNNETAIIEESSAALIVLNILNYSCSWNGSTFRVCESVEWSGGKYAKGYITGGDSIKDAEAFAISQFTYCQAVEKEGNKAVNAYIFDESKKIIKSDLSNRIDCVIGNETIVIISNETIGNVSINEDVVQNISESALDVNVSDISNETFTNITKAIDYEANTSGNIEHTTQYQAVIGQPVRWKKVIKLENETSNLEVELPKEAKVLSVKEIENESVKDITADVFAPDTPLTGLSFLLTGLAIADEVNATFVIIEQPVTEVEIEYETEAPQLYEEEIDNGVRLTLSSNVHYENVYAEITIPESRGELIRLYWVVNGTRELHPIIDYDDNNFDGFIDEIAFVAAHLSTEVFELIYITKAEHLDENYTFILDIYNETAELDDTWSEPIYHNEYIRVTFEKNLTDQNDITIYVRNNQSLNTTVEVYYYNTSTKITEFPIITEEDYYKIFLDGMNENESYGTFDLRIKNLEDDSNAYLEFDHIIDPLVLFIAGNEAKEVKFAIMNESIGSFVMVVEDDTADTAYWQAFFTNGSNSTIKHILQATARDDGRSDISAINDSAFVIGKVDQVTLAAPDWVYYVNTINNLSLINRQADDIDIGASGVGVDVDVAVLNDSNFVTFALDAADQDATFFIHTTSDGDVTGQVDLSLSITSDAGCLDQDCVDVEVISNVSQSVFNVTRAHVWYDDATDIIRLAIMNADKQNITGATQGYVSVDAPGTAAAVAVTGLYDGRLAVAWCDNGDQDVSFKTYDVAINSSVVSNVSGEVDVNLTSGACAGTVGTKIDIAALNTTDGQFVITWDDARINQTSFAIYYSNGSKKVAQTIIVASSSTVNKQVGVVGYDIRRNVSVCAYAPLPAFIVSWNNGTDVYWQTMLNNGSTWNNGCSSPPIVNLTSPPNATSNTSTSHVFFSNATDAKALINATLYANFSGSWAANGSVAVTGTANTTSISVSSIALGGYVWNVLYCDDDNHCTFNSQNFTLTVIAASNSAPPAPALDSPPANNVTTNRSPFFSWNESIDPDGDPVNYTLNITCRGGCASDTRIINVVNRTNFTLTDDLEFFADDGFNYTWTVLATDGTLNSSYNESARNFSIYTLVDISLPSGNVSFGNMSLGTNNDTEDNSPAPFRLQNNGNILINVSINGTSLWSTDINPTSRYQYKIDNVSGENNSFVWSTSNTTYTNMPLTDMVAIIGLNHTDVTDSCQIDINITVPGAEPPGNKESLVIFRGAR